MCGHSPICVVPEPSMESAIRRSIPSMLCRPQENVEIVEIVETVESVEIVESVESVEFVETVETVSGFSVFGLAF